MARLKLTLACGDYDRTHALADGSVRPEGIDLNYIALEPPGEIFWRMLRHEEFDASELSLSAYILGLARREARFVAIPVFPLRAFRHSYFWVSARSGIERPEDLKGKRVALPEYHMTAMLYIRGMLRHDYGVRADDIRWLRTRTERVTLNLPPQLHLEDLGPDRSLARMLERGEIDGVAGTRMPRGIKGMGEIRPLFPNPREAELDYYRRTHIFPIMHVIAIRREVYEGNRWVADSLFKAFQEAKARAYHRMREVTSIYSLPLLNHDVEEARRVFGEDFYPYGVEASRPTLEAALQYSVEQYLSERRLTVEELFAPETIDVFEER
jgi:4,5-dihydroxyphthalate decarboxylase